MTDVQPESLQNLKPVPFEKGNVPVKPQNGPAKQKITDQIRELCEMPIPASIRKRFARARGRKKLEIPEGTKIGEVIAVRAVMYAMQGDFRFYKDVTDRLCGKPVSHVQGSFVTARLDVDPDTGLSVSKAKLLSLLGGPPNEEPEDPEVK